tara:strand:- start:1791 stop:3416 length:1626 start_codon:yes stop_codon:yes gene_type:complete
MRILGVSPAHDSTVCVLNNGQIERFYKEERLTRVKRSSHPWLSLLKIYEEFNNSIDYVVIGSPSPNTFSDIGQWCERVFKCPIEYVCNEHHKQHAALAFCNSGFNEALVLVADRCGTNYGEAIRESETIYHCDYSNGFTELYKSYWRMDINDESLNELLNNLQKKYPHCDLVCESQYSITKVYESATTLIGEHPLENGKTMGLSSYGNDKDSSQLIMNGIPNDRYFYHITGREDFPITVNRKHIDIDSNNFNQESYQFFADYAYQVQKQTQESVGDLIQKYIKPSTRNVCITGGYGLNVVANSYYKKRFPNINFFFEPLADDSGNSIGSSLLMYYKFAKTNTKLNYKNTFFHGIKEDIPKEYEHCTEDFIVDSLLDQKSVAVYHGLAEAGPRSLGNRSILFDCRNRDAKAIVNKIKNREWYRPFAAIVLEEDSYIFDMIGVNKSEYMTMSFSVKEEYKDIVPGIVHVDGTCRIQTISSDHLLYSLLSKLKKKTGYGILLNTSFNIAGEPLVETIQEARKVLSETDLNIVWFPETNQFIMDV